MVIALLSLAYVEEDGAQLSISLLAAALVLTVAALAVCEMLVGPKWIIDSGASDFAPKGP
jgi:hypothetical protein